MLIVILCISPTLQTCQSCSCCFLPGTPPSPNLVTIKATLYVFLCEIFDPPYSQNSLISLVLLPLFSVEPSLETPFPIYSFPYIPSSLHILSIYTSLPDTTLLVYHFPWIPLYLDTPFPGNPFFHILLFVYSFLYINLLSGLRDRKSTNFKVWPGLSWFFGLNNSLPMWVWVSYLIFSSFFSKMILTSPPRFSPPTVNGSPSPVAKA